ncbi:MAG: NAD(P)/FAD-dependent oxidoreductase [Clostridiales bacterium]|nr:NAD(P)/FAD-dependent oxidoreductase [Clostridiales bacterium]
MTYDIAIVGAGVTGAMTARELSRYNLKIALLEKCNDVAMGSTKANSGIVHAGFDAETGSLMAKMNVKGCSMMAETCKKLNVPYKNNGSLVVAFSEDEMEHVQKLYDRGVKNGVPDMKILTKDELLEMEPNLNPDACGALYAPTAGIVCPYELTIAAAECAVSNGVEFIRNCQVKGISTDDDGVTLDTAQGEIKAKYIINAAGVFADEIAKMAGDSSVHITARRGEYFLLDKSVGNTVSHTIFQCPSKMGKGILVAQTVDGNLLMGPTAEDIEDKTDVSTSNKGLNTVKTFAAKSVPSISTRNAITSFTGLRAHADAHEFIIGVSESNPRLINAAGIESPGLSSAPAIAEYIGEIVKGVFGDLEEKSDYDDTRKAPVRFRHMTDSEREALINKNSAYGRIVCRCETVTEGEILDAIHAPAGARDVDGVKRRTRAGMGRCQGGFCGSKVVEILARELNCEINEITKFGGNSEILFDKTK